MILNKEMYENNLKSLYIKHHGKRDTDIWYEQAAVNVWGIECGEKSITLKSHLLTGAVEEFIE